MRICIFHRLSIVCVQKCGFWGFWGWNVKIVYSNPKKHYPAWIRVCWCIACQNRFNGLSSRSVVRFCVQIKKKNSVVTLAIWGQVTPGAILTKCSLWRDMVDVIVITCAIFRGCRLRGVDCGCGERGKFAFSHWLDVLLLQHRSHYCVIIWLSYRLMLKLPSKFNCSCKGSEWHL